MSTFVNHVTNRCRPILVATVASALAVLCALTPSYAEDGTVDSQADAAAMQEAGDREADISYLTQLGLIRGHLAVGYELYRQELHALAETHMKHPREEIYSDLTPQFEDRGCNGFGDELTSLSTAVTSRHSLNDVSHAYENLINGIGNCEAVVDTNDIEVVVRVIQGLLETAAEEYAIGVVEGEMRNLHEFQDAWGFTLIARRWARSLTMSESADAIALGKAIHEIIAELDSLFPALDAHDVRGLDAEPLRLAASNVASAAEDSHP